MIEVFFEYNNVPLFSIELDRSNTVSEMKQKIEKSYSIPVSSQTIFFNGKILFASQDSHTLQECKIFNKSRLELYFPHIRQVLQQREQSPVPTTSIKDIINIEDSPEKDQDSSVVDDQVGHQTEKPPLPPSDAIEASVNPDWLEFPLNPDWLEYSPNPDWLEAPVYPDWLGINDDQVLHQTEQSPVPTTSIKNIINIEDSPEKDQDSSLMDKSENDQVLHQTDKSPLPPSDAIKASVTERSNDDQGAKCSIDIQESSRRNNNSQDLPPMVGSSNQVVQTEKSPQMREVINILDSPEKSSNTRAKNLRVMVLPYSSGGGAVSKLFLVEVNDSENVEELRIELRKMQQKSQLVLPEGGYFFIHKEKVLNEKQSFRLNRINHGDTIQIFPRSVTDDDRADA